MALADARKVFTAHLRRKNSWQAEYRADFATKNLLAVAAVTAEQVVEMLECCQETQYSFYAHLDDPNTTVHDFRPKWDGRRWIVKCYLLAGSAWFISVHPLK